MLTTAASPHGQGPVSASSTVDPLFSQLKRWPFRQNVACPGADMLPPHIFLRPALYGSGLTEEFSMYLLYFSIYIS